MEFKLKDRTNKSLEGVVTRGIELSLRGDEFRAVSLMINQGIPNSVIARVLYQQDRIRCCDLSIIQMFKCSNN